MQKIPVKELFVARIYRFGRGKELFFAIRLIKISGKCLLGGRQDPELSINTGFLFPPELY